MNIKKIISIFWSHFISKILNYTCKSLKIKNKDKILNNVYFDYKEIQ